VAVKVCPDEATFRALVAARLGYDPFAKEGALALRVELNPRGSAVEGSLKLTAAGQPKGDRTLRAPQKDCYELAATLALASAVAIDPESVQARTEPQAEPSEEQPSAQAAQSASQAIPAPLEPRPSSPPVERPEIPPDESRPATKLGVLVDVGPVVSIGLQPGPAVGLRFRGGMHIGLWSIGAEAAAFLPSEQSAPYGTVSAHALYGSLVPCAHPERGRFTVDLCAVVSIGGLFSDATNVGQSRAVTDLHATVGPRLGFTFMPSDSLGFTVNAEAPVNLSRVHLRIDDHGVNREVWAASRLGFIGGASLVLKLQ
jgi:hypothetical protein